MEMQLLKQFLRDVIHVAAFLTRFVRLKCLWLLAIMCSWVNDNTGVKSMKSNSWKIRLERDAEPPGLTESAAQSLYRRARKDGDAFASATGIAQPQQPKASV